MYAVLGWINATILVVLLLPFLLSFLNRHLIRTKNVKYLNFTKIARNFHKPLGITLAVLAPIHGYLALGGFRLHTGTLLYLSAFATSVLGGSFYKLKKRPLFLWHKRMAAITVALLLLHIIMPSALYYLFR